MKLQFHERTRHVVEGRGVVAQTKQAEALVRPREDGIEDGLRNVSV